jgi:cytochrome c biogenesis factor
MDISGLTIKELAYYGFLIGVCVAVVCALITLFLGFKKNKAKIGVWGCIAILAGGLALGLFAAIPLFILFLWLIFKKPASAEPVADPFEESAETTNGPS